MLQNDRLYTWCDMMLHMYMYVGCGDIHVRLYMVINADGTLLTFCAVHTVNTLWTPY